MDRFLSTGSLPQAASGNLDEHVFERRGDDLQALQLVPVSFQVFHQRHDGLRRARGVQHGAAVEGAAIGHAVEGAQFGIVHLDGCADLVKGLLSQQIGRLEPLLGLAAGSLDCFQALFGVSSLCNILGAIHMARFLDLGPKDNVVTIATDGFDRYPSVLADLEKRRGPFTDGGLKDTFGTIFRSGATGDVLDVRSPEQKNRLFGYKAEVWSTFGYSHSYLEGMKSQSFWEDEFHKITGVDEALARARRL